VNHREQLIKQSEQQLQQNEQLIQENEQLMQEKEDLKPIIGSKVLLTPMDDEEIKPATYEEITAENHRMTFRLSRTMNIVRNMRKEFRIKETEIRTQLRKLSEYQDKSIQLLQLFEEKEKTLQEFTQHISERDTTILELKNKILSLQQYIQSKKNLPQKHSVDKENQSFLNNQMLQKQNPQELNL